MFRFVMSVLWGVASAFIIYAANATIFPSFASLAVFAALAGLTLWGADTVIAASVAHSVPDTVSWTERLRERPLILRLAAWVVFYEFAPAMLIYLLSQWGVFVLPSGLFTALAMCLPLSLVTLRDYVNLSWLAR